MRVDNTDSKIIFSVLKLNIKPLSLSLNIF